MLGAWELTGYNYRGEFIPLANILTYQTVIGATIYRDQTGAQKAVKTSDLTPVYADTGGAQSAPVATSALSPAPSTYQTVVGPVTGPVTGPTEGPALTTTAIAAGDGGGAAETALLPTEPYAYGRDVGSGAETTPEGAGFAPDSLLIVLAVILGAVILTKR